MWELAYLLLALLGLAFISGRIAYQRRLKQAVKKLFAQAKPLPPAASTDPHTFGGLPKPVQQYFQQVLPKEQVPIQYVRMKHSGRFKTGTDKAWIPIQGEQYFTTNPPQFIWQGKTLLFSARDSYIQDTGCLKVHLLSVLPVVNATGAHVNQGELLRWLAEAIWFPACLLPRPGLHWEALDPESARLVFSHAGITVAYTVFFSAAHEIERLETERYMAENRLEKWTGTCQDYQEVSGMRIPRRIQATWNLAEGDHTYADFVVDQIEYGVAEPY